MQKMKRQRWEELKAQAEAGDSEAQWEVGSWLEDGLADEAGAPLVKVNAREAVRWYRKSAEAGNASGQNNLGNCYCAGRGVRRNYAEALRWFKRAARQGDWCARLNVAHSYGTDLGNARLAMRWYQRAAAAGDGDAMLEVGRGYYKGAGVRRDAGEAVRYFRSAIASRIISQWGCEEAMIELGIAYHEGQGVRKSNARALYWLRRSNKDDDHPEARALIENITQGH
jgi:TPR repeat protein